MKLTVVEVRYFGSGERHRDVETFDDEQRARQKVEALEGHVAANGYTHGEDELRAPSYVVRHDSSDAVTDPDSLARKRK